jgi:Domain of unknown function (DUF397)
MMPAPEPDGIVGHTSSYRNGGTACVEVGCVEVSWRTSSYSASSGACVEVALAPDGVLVRDSKDRGGAVLTVPPTAWHTFLATLPR